MRILSVTVPLFFFLAVGMLGKKKGLITDNTKNFLNKLLYYVGMPSMIFKGIVAFDFTDTFRLDLVAHNLLTTAIVFLLTFGAALLIRDKKKRGAFHMGCFRPNQGYIGLPVVNGFYGEQAVSRAAVINGFDSPYCVLLSVFSLEVFRTLAQRRADRAGALRTLGIKLLDFLRNPFLIATVLGLLCSYFKIPVLENGIARELLNMATGMALPLALLTIGCSISLSTVRGNMRLMLWASLIRLAAAPALALALALWVFKFTGTDLGFSVILTATPTSVSSYIMAAEMDADGPLMAAIIGFTTFLSVVTLSLWQYFLQGVI